jgi:hypothetical protein
MPEPIRMPEAGRMTFPTTPAYFTEALENAERLLMHASENGVEVDPGVRDDILQARAITVANWDEEMAARVLAALAKLTFQLKPVTGDSLKAYCSEGVLPTVRNYWLVALALAVFITPFSLAGFVSSAIATTIRADVTAANELAVKLRAELGPPIAGAYDSTVVNPNDSSTIGELQQYAGLIRAIDTRTRELNALVLFAEKDPLAAKRKDPKAIHDVLQLPSALPNLAVAANDRTLVYQDVRYFAQSVLDDVSFFYGALTACVLPVLYALLGTCAFLLRTFEQQMATRTFVPSTANSARFLIAGIGGAVVGLFNNFTIGQSASIPPLALAFLVGYAVDVFFAFLEGMLNSLTKKAG